MPTSYAIHSALFCSCSFFLDPCASSVLSIPPRNPSYLPLTLLLALLLALQEYLEALLDASDDIAPRRQALLVRLQCPPQSLCAAMVQVAPLPALTVSSPPCPIAPLIRGPSSSQVRSQYSEAIADLIRAAVAAPPGAAREAIFRGMARTWRTMATSVDVESVAEWAGGQQQRGGTSLAGLFLAAAAVAGGEDR